MKNLTFDQIRAAIKATNQKEEKAAVKEKAEKVIQKSAETVKNITSKAAGYVPVTKSGLDKVTDHHNRVSAIQSVRLNRIEAILVRAGLAMEEEFEDLDQEEYLTIFNSLKAAARPKHTKSAMLENLIEEVGKELEEAMEEEEVVEVPAQPKPVKEEQAPAKKEEKAPAGEEKEEGERKRVSGRKMRIAFDRAGLTD